LLAAGGQDGIVRVWHVFGPARPKGQEAAKLPSQELDALWDALADGDAAKAYRPVATLAARPGQARHLLPRPPRPARAGEAAGALLTREARAALLRLKGPPVPASVAP